jgi:hypothetical protein
LLHGTLKIVYQVYHSKQESKKSIEEKNKKIDEQSNIANKSIDQLKVDPKR